MDVFDNLCYTRIGEGLAPPEICQKYRQLIDFGRSGRSKPLPYE
jgi:hypothetical protein